MRKIIVWASVAFAVALAHAGTVKWDTVSMYGANNSKVGGNATLYVYMLDNQEAFDAVTDVWATFGADVKAGGASATNAGGTKSKSYTNAASVSAPSGTATANTTYYAALIATIGTGDDMMYFAEKQSITTGDDGNYAYKLGLGVLDNAATAKTAWTSATTPVTPPGPGSDPSGIPEPTSGLLLVMGGALLALRRKQK